jgi:biotin/methionine sulfoxide reductase
MKRASLLRLATLRGRFFRHVVESDVEGPPYAGSSGSLLPPIEAQGPTGSERLILQPMIRKSYYDRSGTGLCAERGQEPFVAVGWDEALERVAEAIASTKAAGASIYGGTFSRSEGGLFHDPQSQLQRFLRYSGDSPDITYTHPFTVEETLAYHVIGDVLPRLADAQVLENCKRVVCFAGSGQSTLSFGSDAHPESVIRAKSVADKGIPVVNIGPVRDSIDIRLRACWLKCRPASDVAVMLCLIHTLIEEELYNRAFVDRYCTGFDVFADYVLGVTDGIPKNAGWASAQSLVPEEDLLMLARLMAAEPCVVQLSASVLSVEHGEQVLWAAIALVAALGYLGAANAGLLMECKNHDAHTQRPMWPFVFGSESGPCPDSFRLVPFGRLAEMLESPGRVFQLNGATIRYPDIGLVYLVADIANPQNFNHLRAAWASPETVVCHASSWTPTSRFADIVLPHLPPAELKDFDLAETRERAHTDFFSESLPEAWSDYDIFSALADKLGFGQSFSRGRCATEWIAHLSQRALKERTPGNRALKETAESFERFLSAPETYPLKTPSGKVELFSKTIADFGYRDCGEHPAWYEKREWLGSSLAAVYPFHLLSADPPRGNEDTTGPTHERRHGSVRINPRDAFLLQLQDGDLSMVSNARGGFIARVLTSTDVSCGVLQVSHDSSLELLDVTDRYGISRYGNPCTVTSDGGTSSLSQSPTINSCLVNIEKVEDLLAFTTGSTGPEILYNVSPTAIRFASRR